MKKNLQTAFSTRQYMISRDFEIYYYNDHSLSRVDIHDHDYYEFYMFLEGNVSMQSMVLRLIEEMKTERFGRTAHISICVQDLVLMMNRMIYEQNHPSSQYEESSLYQNLLIYIEEHLDEPLMLEQLARQFYVSKYHISHIFKDNFGLSVHQYIIKKRLAACREAIMSHVSISEVYLNYGFGDYSSFYRAFKKEYGISPKDFQAVQLRNLERNKGR